MSDNQDELLGRVADWLDGQRGTSAWDEGDELLESLAELVKGPKRSLVRFHDPAAIVQRIEGTIEFDDGTGHQFSIGTDGQWQQWGAQQPELGRSVDLLEEMTQAAILIGHFQERDENGDLK